LEILRNYLNTIRREFANKPLDESSVPSTPYQLFHSWFEEAVSSQILDPYAMIISTVDASLRPSSRVVYMRDIIAENGIIFYTNYNSRKGQDIESHPDLSALFYWAELDRQIRVDGKVQKVSEELSDKYFASRPRESQIGAWASNQSEVIATRETLEKQVEFYTEKFKDKEVPRPPHWGGYILIPSSFEFWQGRPSRLHDRILFSKQNELWKIERLAP
jgi:pyridoxamine 5'-phosphate oxidase